VLAAWMKASPTAAPRPAHPNTGVAGPPRSPSERQPASAGGRVNELALELDNPLSYVNADLAFVAEEVARLARRLEAAGPGCTELAEAARQILEAAADARQGVEKLRWLARELQSLPAQAGSGPRTP